jgi:ribose/xylose/arabinose/galactoside ABC-type transport system permease subunit
MSSSESTIEPQVTAPSGLGRGVRARLRRSDNMRTYVPLVLAILALGAYASAKTDLFLTSGNINVLLDSVAVLGLITVGMTLLC